MQILPNLKACRIAQLGIGDLFIYPHKQGASIAILAVDPVMDGDKGIVIMGPEFPEGLTGPTLINLREGDAISFGKDFCLRLPVRPEGWSVTPPAINVPCLAVAEEAIYFCASFGGDTFCYVNASTGIVECSQSGRAYVVPRGIRGYAVKWDILTVEEDARTILTYQ